MEKFSTTPHSKCIIHYDTLVYLTYNAVIVELQYMRCSKLELMSNRGYWGTDNVWWWNTDTSSVLRQALFAHLWWAATSDGACDAAPSHIKLFLLQDGSHTKPLPVNCRSASRTQSVIPVCGSSPSNIPRIFTGLPIKIQGIFRI
jgi:hypothetical protein